MTNPLPALATTAQLSNRLGGRAIQAGWAEALLDASSALRDIIGQPLTPGTATLAQRLDDSGRTLLPLCPITAVVSVVDPNGDTLPSDGSAYDVDGQRLRVFHPRGSNIALPVPHPVYTVTVEHGWDPIPGELLRWVFVLAAAQVKLLDQGNFGGAGGIESVAVDDGKVTYAAGGDASAYDLASMVPDRVQARLRATYGGEQS